MQQAEKRLAARRTTEGLALANSKEDNEADERLSTCPQGALHTDQYSVTTI